MDPLSIFFGLTSVLTSAVQGAQALSDLLGSIKGAPEEIRNISQDVAALHKLLVILEGFLKENQVPTYAASSLSETVRNCMSAIDTTQDQIKSYTKVGGDGKLTKWRSITWAFNRGSAKELRDRLLHHKMNLSISVDVINGIKARENHLVISEQIGQGAEVVRLAVSNLETEMRTKDAQKVRVASITGRRGSQSGATDVGWTMRKFLEVLPPDDYIWSEAGDTFNVNSTNLGEEDDDDAIIPEFNVIRLPFDFKLSPLHQAVCRADRGMVISLLDQGADVNEKGFDDCTPLHLCADLDNGPLAQVFLGKGAQTEVTDTRRRTPLNYAMLSRSRTVALVLLDYGAKLDSVWTMISILMRSPKTSESTDMLKALLERAKTKALTNNQHLNILHKAVEDGNMPMLTTLLEMDFDVNARDDLGFTALHYAAASNRLVEAEALLKAGADINAKTPRDARVEPDVSGLAITALFIAAGCGHYEMMELLIAKGIDVNALDLSGGNALQPLGGWPPRYCELLLDAGADMENQKHGGENILHWATVCNNVPLINLLLDRGANISSETRAGFRPLHAAARHGYLEVTNLLILRGANINHYNIDGTTALHEAVRTGTLDVVKALVEHGSINLRDHTGETPLIMAERLGKKDKAEYLRAANLTELVMAS